MSSKTDIDFYYSISSRYSYLASTQIDALESETGCTVSWFPVDGRELRALAASEPFKELPSGQYRSPYREQDIQGWADYYGVPYREPPDANSKIWWADYDARPLARAAAAAKRLGKGAVYSRLLYDTFFASDTWPVDDAVLQRTAIEAGLASEEFSRAFREPETEAYLAEVAAQARQHGTFGVPTFVYCGRMFFGNDRIVLLKHHIAKCLKDAE